MQNIQQGIHVSAEDFVYVISKLGLKFIQNVG